MQDLIEETRQYLCDEAKAWVFQHERGAEGTDHLQVYVKYRNQKAFHVVRQHFNNFTHAKPCHAEKVVNVARIRKYCSKEESRIAGPWSEGIPASEMTQPQARDPLASVELYGWQHEVITYIREEPHDREIVWLWEPEGRCGKNSLCKHLVLQHDAMYVSGTAKDILYAVGCWIDERGPPRIIIWNVPRSVEGRISWQAIEQCKDGLAFCGKYESKQLCFNPPHILCFANFEPDTTALSRDRWTICRITTEGEERFCVPQLRA